MGKLMKSRV